jgi:hypothetical protein
MDERIRRIKEIKEEILRSAREERSRQVENLKISKKKTGVVGRIQEVKRRKADAEALQDTIFMLLPTKEDKAISIRDLKIKLPNISSMRLAMNAHNLFKGGRCYKTKIHDVENADAHIHCYYWKREEKTQERKRITRNRNAPKRNTILALLPETEEGALTAEGLKGMHSEIRYVSVASILSKAYYQGLVKRTEEVPFMYWKNGAKRETSNFTMTDNVSIEEGKTTKLIDSFVRIRSKNVVHIPEDVRQNLGFEKGDLCRIILYKIEI